MKKLALTVVFCCLLTAALYANVISFYVVETGLPMEGDMNRSSILWENAFMDVFFDAGFIVTNYPMLRLEEKPTDSILQASGFDIYEARDASVDYILIAQLDYSDPLAGPDEVSIFVFKVTNHSYIYQKKIPGKSFKNEKDAVDELTKVVRELVPVISLI